MGLDLSNRFCYEKINWGIGLTQVATTYSMLAYGLFYRLVQQSLMADPVTERELKAEVPAADDDDFDVMDEWIDHNI